MKLKTLNSLQLIKITLKLSEKLAHREIPKLSVNDDNI